MKTSTRAERAQQAFADNPDKPEADAGLTPPGIWLQPLPWPGFEYWLIDIRIEVVAQPPGGGGKTWTGDAVPGLADPALKLLEMTRQWQDMAERLLALPWILLMPPAQRTPRA